MNIKLKAALVYIFLLTLFMSIIALFLRTGIIEHFITLFHHIVVIAISIYGYNDILNDLQKKKEEKS